MTRENVDLTVGAGRRNDDFKLYHECNLSRNDSTTKPPATAASHDRRRRVAIRNARAIAHVTMAPSGGDEGQHDCCPVIGIEVGRPGLADGVAQGCLKTKAQPVTWFYFFTLTSSSGVAICKALSGC